MFDNRKEQKEEKQEEKKGCAHPLAEKTYYGPIRDGYNNLVHGWYWKCPDCGESDSHEETLD